MPYSICTEIRWGNLEVMKSDLCESREALWNNVTARKTQLNVWWYFPVIPLKRPYIHLAKVLFLPVSPKWCAQCLSVSGTITYINCLSAHSRLCSNSHRHTVCWHRHLGSRWHSRNWLSLLGTKEQIWGAMFILHFKEPVLFTVDSDKENPEFWMLTESYLC